MAVWKEQALALSLQPASSPGSKSHHKKSLMYECGLCIPDVQALSTHFKYSTPHLKVHTHWCGLTLGGIKPRKMLRQTLEVLSGHLSRELYRKYESCSLKNRHVISTY